MMDMMSAAIFWATLAVSSSFEELEDAVLDFDVTFAAANSSAEITPSPFLSRLESGL
jgi:hypothetical protein